MSLKDLAQMKRGYQKAQYDYPQIHLRRPEEV
jgi:hypothetical protein